MTDIRLANEAWEALFRAQVLLLRSFAADDVWIEVTQTEYDVLYTLAKAPGELTMVEVNDKILMTQGGVSKLVGRLVERGLIERRADLDDRRATRLSLSTDGRELQRVVGRRHARAVLATMSSALKTEQLIALRDISNQIITACESSPGDGSARSFDRSGR